jgi:hypothetical protein
VEEDDDDAGEGLACGAKEVEIQLIEEIALFARSVANFALA